MNSLIVEKKSAGKVKFPVLMLNKDIKDGKLIVLFVSEEKGTVVLDTNETYKVGECDTDWISCFNEDEWERFSGAVQLQND